MNDCFKAQSYILKTLVIALLFASKIVSAQNVLVVAEDFDDNRRNWYKVKNEFEQIIIKGGFLEWATYTNKPRFEWQSFNIDWTTNFEISTSIFAENKSEFAFAWGGSDISNCNLIIIQNNLAKIVQIKNGTWSTIVENLALKVAQHYHFIISQSVESISIKINNLEVYSGKRMPINGQKVGYVNMGVNYLKIDNLFLKSFVPNLVVFQETNKLSKPVNMGENINTIYDEIAVVVADNDSTLYFSRRNAPENTIKATDDIYTSQLSNNNAWQKALSLGTPLNNVNYNYVCSTVPNSNGIIVSNSYQKPSEIVDVSKPIAISVKNNKEWNVPIGIAIKDFYTLSATNDYKLSSDGKIIIMSIQRKDSFGKNDLYYSKEVNGIWLTPINLGNVINTSLDEISPFLTKDNKTLFFSSRGHQGLGEADIFVSKRLDDTWQKWSSPINLGAPINSEFFDGYFNFAPNSNFAYYISQSEQNHDIFQVAISSELKRYMLNLDSVTTQKSKLDYKNIAFKNIIFDRSDVEIASKSLEEIEKILQILIQNPTCKVELIGHTDNQGDRLSNLELSLSRAQKIKQILVDKGVASHRILTIGLGGAYPFTNNTSESSRKLNRRVEVKIIP